MAKPSFKDFNTERSHMISVDGMVNAVVKSGTSQDLDTVLGSALESFCKIYPASPLKRWLQ